MDYLKKLLHVKRVLAMVLAVAITVTSVPATALAAPADEQIDTEQSAQTLDGDTSDVDSAVTKEPATEGDVSGAEYGTPDEEDQLLPAAADTPDAETGDDATLAGDVETYADGDVQYVLMYTDYLDLYTTADYQAGESPFADGVTPKYDILDNIYVYKDGGFVGSLNDYEEEGVTVTYTWKQGGTALGADKAPTDAGDYTLEIALKKGNDTLANSESEGLPLNFTIKKAVVTVTFDLSKLNVTPGSTVKTFTDALQAAGYPLYVDSSDGADIPYSTEDAAKANNVISVSAATVKKADVVNEADAVLDDDDRFVKNQDYVVIPSAAFAGTDAATYNRNYDLVCKGVQITVGANLVATRVDLTVSPSDTYTTTTAELTSDKNTVTAVKFELSKATDSAITGLAKAIESSAKVYERVEKKVENEEPTLEDGAQITDAKPTGAWYAAVYSDWKEGDKTYASLTVEGKMNVAPKGAGTYVYRVSYDGEEGLYASSYADIVVEIGTVELIVKPKWIVNKETVAFGREQTVANVLAAVEDVVVNPSDSNWTIPTDLKDRFFGTGYNASGYTQPYEPVFEVVKIKDGVITPLTGKLGSPEKDVKYAVRFTGNKAIYSSGGSAYNTKGVNVDVDSWNGSYRVLDDEETRSAEDNIVYFNITDKQDVIDVDDIIKAAGLESESVLSEAIDNYYKEQTKDAEKPYDGAVKVLTKVYDGKQLFSDRAAYKKAKLTDKTNTNQLTDFTYRWYVLEDVDAFKTVEDVVEEKAGEKEGEKSYELKDADEFFSNYGWDELDENVYNNKISFLSNANIYKLVISYNNSTDKETVAEDAVVYFVIDKQELTLKVKETEEPYTGYEGTAREFVNSIEDMNTIELEVTPANSGNPSTAEQWKREFEDIEYSPYSYKVSWKVQKQTTDDDGTKKWTDVGDYEILQASETDVYQIMVDKFTLGKYASWYFNNYEPVIGEPNTASVKAIKMGDTVLSFDNAIERTMEYSGKSIFEVFGEDITALGSPKFYTTDAEGNKTDVTNAASDKVSLNYVVEYSYDDDDREYTTLPVTADDWAWAVNGGTYTIKAYFEGNVDYAPIGITTLAKITVTRRQLMINAPELTVKVGTSVTTVASNAQDEFRKPEVADVVNAVDGDIEKYFTKILSANGVQTYLAWCDEDGYSYDDYPAPKFEVYKGSEVAAGSLDKLGNETYTLKLKIDEYNGYLNGIAWRNYKVLAGDAVPITVVRDYSTLDTTTYGTITTAVRAADSVVSIENGSYRHDFTTLAAVPVVEHAGVRGNWVAVRIEAPQQYNSFEDAIYEQAIRSAGGKIVSNNYYDKYITVAFNLSELPEDDRDVKFNIRWEDDYIEQFNLQFSKSECLGDLEYAVAPKSLAFNSPKKTMVVGEEQKLDVKVTKQQISDVICLGYEADENYLHVDEYGQVTALKKGKGKVTVYPMRVVDGVKEKIAGKSATVTITVKDVAAPKISKVTAKDTSATVRYPFVDDAEYGYRREIYVMKGSKKAGDFEKEIDAMQNEQWQGHFEIAPKFVTLTNERNSRVWDVKKQAYLNIVELTLSGLEPNESYTVYVRNVSAVRTLGDGCQVQESHAGNVKTFKMTKPMLSYMSMGLKLKDGTSADYKYDNYYNRGYYTVELADGSAQIVLNGYFTDLNDAADANDTVYYSLSPKNSTDKKKYTAPKISYSWEVGNFAQNRYVAKSADPTLSDVVKIANNGKITLKQPTMGSTYNMVKITAKDTVSGKSASLIIHIVAEADSMKAKKVTLSAGQTITLERLVDYKQRGKTLDQTYYDVTGRIDRQKVADQLENSDKLKLTGSTLRAYGGGSASLKLYDLVKGFEATATIKSTDLAAVKSLTVTNVIDNKATVQFEKNDYASGYRIDVTDARNKLVGSVYIANNTTSSYQEDSSYEGVYGWQTGLKWHYVGTGKKQKTYITYRFNGTTIKLIQQSKYTVKVTALYVEDGGTSESNDTVVSSKVASKAFTTTKMPAADTPLKKSQENNGNITIGVRYTSGSYTGNWNGIYNYNFVSGNTYTLVATPNDGNKAAQYAATDTLTWTSSNKKVATVKSNAGSYNATLKAVKNGKTTIEVKSKILKQVIARYEISVRTVGDAYSGKPYYGDEDLRNGKTNGSLTKELELGVPVTIELTGGQTSMQYTFTAPQVGTYRRVVRNVNGVTDVITYTYYNKNTSQKVYDANTSDNGKTIWVEPVLTGEENRTVLNLNETKSAENNQWFVFTAPADGYYKFGDSSSYVYVYEVGEDGTTRKDSAEMYQLKKDDIVYLQARETCTITARQVTFRTLTEGSAVTFSVTPTEPVYFRFTPSKTDKYVFTCDWDTYFDVWIDIYKADLTESINTQLNCWASSPSKTSNQLTAGEEVVIKVYPYQNSDNYTARMQVAPATTD